MPMTPQHHKQRGIALMEALVALVVLALGLLGLVASQARLVADSRSSAQRAVAIGLIEDLSNRVQINSEQALAGAYDLAWGVVPAAANCVTANCTAAVKAQSDLRQWQQALQAQLPAGVGTVFRSASDPRQIGIAVSWVANESGADATERSARLALLNTSFEANGGTLNCPSGNHCQVLYVQP